jgi:uncharacterized iron-regulated protein
MKKFLLLFLLLPILSRSQEKITEANYRIYSVKLGKEVSLKDIADDMDTKDVLFLGEEHNDSVTHYLEQTLFIFLYQKYNAGLALSM